MEINLPYVPFLSSVVPFRGEFITPEGTLFKYKLLAPSGGMASTARLPKLLV
jgi:hypothetical protein